MEGRSRILAVTFHSVAAADGDVRAPGRLLFSAPFALIFNLDFAVDGVAFERHRSGFFFDLNAHQLMPVLRRARLANNVLFENDVFGLAPNPNARHRLLQTVIFNHVALEPVAVAGHAEAFVAEINPILLVAPHLIEPQQIVGVLVPDGDAVTAVAFEHVLLKHAVPDPPAQRQPVLAVVARRATAHQGPLRTAARMDAERSVVLAHAVLHDHIVGLLEADAVAVVVAHAAVADDRAEAAIQENARPPAAVEGSVVVLVPLDGQVFDAGAFDVVTADDRKHGRRLGPVAHHAIGVQR